MRLFALALLAASAHVVAALPYGHPGSERPAPLDVERLTDGDDFAFPLIHAPDSIVQRKINAHLQLSELELLRGHEEDGLFEAVTGEGESIHGSKSSVEYAVLANSQTALSLRFDEAACGITCRYWTAYYSFNPANGDRYFLQDFFDGADLDEFRRLVLGIREAHLRRKIESADISDARAANVLAYALPALEDDDLTDFHLAGDSIHLDHRNLLSKNERFLEIDHTAAVAVAEVEPLLNDLGRATLLGEGDLEPLRSSREPQLYRGAVDGAHEFVFVMRPDGDRRWEGIYAYLRYGRGISLVGERTDGAFVFREMTGDADEPSAVIRFRRSERRLVGTWTSADGARELSFRAERM